LNSLIWFKNNLRIADNHALTDACSHDSTIAIFCFNPNDFEKGNFGFKKTGAFRVQFLIESLLYLKEALQKLNITLLIFHEKPEIRIPQVIEQYEIDTVYLQAEWTRDENDTLAKTKKNSNPTVKFIETCDQFLYHPEDVPFENFGAIPDVFTFFRKKVEKYGKVRPVLEKPDKKPTSNLLKQQTKLPSLKELGFQGFQVDARSAFPFKGGEDKAIERIETYFWKSKNLASYKQTRNGLIGLDYSSKLSAWLANGCISPKTIYKTVKEFEHKIVKNQDTYWLIFELIWRDFFKYISLKHKDKIFHLGGILERPYDWGISSRILQQWISGNTNEPFINANMKELAATGWMSNRGRQNVASYWAKELQQDWRIGAAYFESILIDYDVHSNWCNWMYLSGVGNDPRDRKFNIKRQADMYDKNGKYQKLWL